MKHSSLQHLIAIVIVAFVLGSCRKDKDGGTPSSASYFDTPLEKKCRTVHVFDSLDQPMYTCYYNDKYRIQTIDYLRSAYGYKDSGKVSFTYSGNELSILDTSFQSHSRSSISTIISDEGRMFDFFFKNTYDANGFVVKKVGGIFVNQEIFLENDGRNYTSCLAYSIDSAGKKSDTSMIEWTYYAGTQDRHLLLYNQHTEQFDLGLIFNEYSFNLFIPNISGKVNSNLLKSVKYTHYVHYPDVKELSTAEYSYDLNGAGDPIKIKAVSTNHGTTIRNITYEQCN